MFAFITTESSGAFKAVSEDSFFIIPAAVALTEHLKKDSPLTEEEFNVLKEKCDLFLCRQKALSLLALREHNAYELSVKLRQKGFADCVVKRAVSSLKEEGSLNELRYCISFIESRLKKYPESGSMMAMRLASHGAEKSAAAEAVSGIYTPEFSAKLRSRAKEEVLRKYKDRNRALGAFVRLGYTVSSFDKADETGF